MGLTHRPAIEAGWRCPKGSEVIFVDAPDCTTFSIYANGTGPCIGSSPFNEHKQHFKVVTFNGRLKEFGKLPCSRSFSGRKVGACSKTRTGRLILASRRVSSLRIHRLLKILQVETVAPYRAPLAGTGVWSSLIFAGNPVTVTV